MTVSSSIFGDETSHNGEHGFARPPQGSRQVSRLNWREFEHDFRQNGKSGKSGNFLVPLGVLVALFYFNLNFESIIFTTLYKFGTFGFAV